MDQTKLFIVRAIRTMNWRFDVESGEMIEQDAKQIFDSPLSGMQYCKDHLSHPGPISQKDIDSICAIVNLAFYNCGSDLMVKNSMGEFIPVHRSDYEA